MVEKKGDNSMKTISYFMENEEWYYYNEKESKYKLTNNAPKKAIKSYEEFYEDNIKFDNGEWKTYHC